MEAEKSIVLVVDDDTEIHVLANRYFSEIHNHELVIADGFDQAVKAIHDIRGEMVAFVDIHLRGKKSGLDVLAYIQDNASHRVVPYGFTGETSLDIEAKALSAGAINVFHKSVDGWDRLVVYTEQSLIKRLLRRGFEDNLTGLNNFDWLRRAAKAEMAAARDRKDDKHPKVFSLLFIDLDNLRMINNVYGHLSGDKAIQTVAEVLKSHIRPLDHLCRKGGDEFLIWMPNMDEDHSDEVGMKLARHVSERFIRTEVGLEIPLSVSIGAAQLHRNEIGEDLERDLEDFISRANHAEMRAKERGKAALKQGPAL